MIAPSPATQPQTNQTPQPPSHTPAPSPKRPPLAKPSSAPPKRKRRRPPPPLSVTSVFTQQRLPTNASELWDWPVTSWYAGEVGQHDLKLATEQPFLDHQALASHHEAKTPPNHYRLRWLHQDASRIVHPNRAETRSVLEPFHTLPYPGKEDTGACQRPMPGVKRLLEEPHDHKISSSLSRRNPKRARTASRANRRNASESNHHNGPASPPTTVPADVQPTPQVHSQTCPVDLAPVHPGKEILHHDGCHNHSAVEASPAKAAGKLPTPLPRHQDPSLDPHLNPSPKVLSNHQSVNGIKSHDNQILPKNEPLDQSEPIDPCVSTSKEVNTPSAGVMSSDAREKRFVNLQFKSPHEPRLMGSITYSVSIPPVSDGADKRLKNDIQIAKGNNPPMEADVHPESFDLQFRRADQDFVVVFDDRDVADELPSEIRKRSNVLLPLDERAKPLRSAMLHALQNEMEKQKEFADLVDEGNRLAAKLKEIQQQKKAAKYAARKAANDVGSAGRRSSDRKRVASQTDDLLPLEENGRRSRSRSRRPSRPSRKVIDEIDIDDDDPNEQGETEPILPDLVSSPCDRDTGAHVHKPAQTDTSVVDAVASPAGKASDSAETLATIPHASTHGMRATAQAENEACAEPGPSTASSPSDDGTEMCIMKSPCGLFPGESEDASQLACIASPVSPLRVASPGARNGNYPQLKIALKLGTSPK